MSEHDEAIKKWADWKCCKILDEVVSSSDVGAIAPDESDQWDDNEWEEAIDKMIVALGNSLVKSVIR